MSVEQAFLQWYAQLFPEDQIYLCNFLRDWLSQQGCIIPQLAVVQIFLQGYGQIPLSEQQTLCNFLRNWLNPPPSSSQRVNPLRFSGKYAGPVGINIAGSPKKVVCPHCKHEFETTNP